MYRCTFSWSRQLHSPPALPQENSPWYILGRRLGGPHNGSGRRKEKKNLALPGLKLRPLSVSEPIASNYTDCAIPSPVLRWYKKKMLRVHKAIWRWCCRQLDELTLWKLILRICLYSQFWSGWNSAGVRYSPVEWFYCCNEELQEPTIAVAVSWHTAIFQRYKHEMVLLHIWFVRNTLQCNALEFLVLYQTTPGPLHPRVSARLMGYPH
jgi:hypothetical protein